MQLRFIPAALLCSLLILPGSSLADDDAPPGLDVKLVNLASGKGSSFSLTGKTKPLPDGTRIVISLGALGKTRNYVATIKRGVVHDNEFHISQVWPKKRLAPLLYRVRVELNLKKQPPAIRNWIMTEYGFAPTHREILDQVETRVGTEEEQIEFTLSNLNTLEAIALRLQDVFAEVKILTAKPAAEIPDYKQQEKEINGRLRKLRAAIDLHYVAHVVLLEQGFRKRIKGGGSDLSLFLRNHSRGRSHLEALGELGQRFATTVTMIRQLKPTPLTEPLIPYVEDSEDDEDSEE